MFSTRIGSSATRPRGRRSTPTARRRAEGEKDPVTVDRAGELTTTEKQRAERGVRDDRQREQERHDEAPAHVRFHRGGHARIGHVVALHLVAAVRRRLQGRVVHRLVRADLRAWERDRIEEVAVGDLAAEGRRVGQAWVHRDVRDPALEVDVNAHDVRQLTDGRREVVLTARAEDILERDHERLRRMGRVIHARVPGLFPTLR